MMKKLRKTKIKKITFIICDSGNGFLESNEQPQVIFREHGRGVDLLNEIAHSVKYNHAGNEVEIVYSLR